MSWGGLFGSGTIGLITLPYARNDQRLYGRIHIEKHPIRSDSETVSTDMLSIKLHCTMQWFILRSVPLHFEKGDYTVTYSTSW